MEYPDDAELCQPDRRNTSVLSSREPTQMNYVELIDELFLRERFSTIYHGVFYFCHLALKKLGALPSEILAKNTTKKGV